MNTYFKSIHYTPPLVPIEVFKSDIKNLKHAHYFKSELLKWFADLKVDFDLEDCDRILRIEGQFDYQKLYSIASTLNITIAVLKD